MKDATIIGAGPSGLTALLYTTMYGLDAVCIGDVIGGKLLIAPGIIDYPGITEINGKEFIARIVTQLERVKAVFEAKTVREVQKVEGKESYFEVFCEDNSHFQSKTVVIATGNPNKQAGNKAHSLGQMLNLNHRNKQYLVDIHMMTNVSGVFAAGDCVSYPYSFEQLATSVAAGIKAAGGIYRYLSGKYPPILWGKTKIPRFV